MRTQRLSQSNVTSAGYRRVMNCPKCNGKLYLEDREEYSGEEDGYAVMCFDCAWVDEFAYVCSDHGYNRLKELQRKPTISDKQGDQK